MPSLKNYVSSLEKLSLLTCSPEVLAILERSLKNVEKILSVNTEGIPPLVWQNKIDVGRLHSDTVQVSLTTKDLKLNANQVVEDYVAIGIHKKNQ